MVGTCHDLPKRPEFEVFSPLPSAHVRRDNKHKLVVDLITAEIVLIVEYKCWSEVLEVWRPAKTELARFKDTHKAKEILLALRNNGEERYADWNI